MSRSTIVICFLFLALSLLGQSVAMPPRRVRERPPPLDVAASSSSSGQPSKYEALYQSLLDPFGWYQENPTHYAPMGSPRGNVRIPAGHAEMYLGYLRDNPAYISPSAADELNAILNRVRDMVNSPTPPTSDDQRALVGFLEEAANRSRRDLMSPLHPENVTSQHISPVEKLSNKYKALTGLLQNRHWVDRLTNQLDPDQQERFLAANSVLSAEQTLLETATEYAGTFPRLP
ncbi:related to conserved hypothetical Ustilaginaceae-specific protein [Ustilago trichophora]|uniref:Related to conserved hypothetical Ustilaginaceae-specific protein n=1 Tax=Ustilago trichophora TaxID=86804 RepID=A0A5C3E7J4_9BASI|nr:related to conserved hypothetical Ustilaginaceae-specific protein [Ustilago trichophora]